MTRDCKEIRTYLDSLLFSDLSGPKIESVRLHTTRCDECSRALTATLMSAELIKVRREESEQIHPPPFFESMVMKAVKARNTVVAPISAFTRWWKATSSILAFSATLSMIFIVVALMTTKEQVVTSSASNNLYPAESVILDQTSGRDLTNEQVLQVVYNPRYEESK